MTRPPGALLASAIAGSILAISTAAVLIRLAEAPAVSIAFYRLLYATLALLPFALWKARAELRSLSARDWVRLGLVGVALAVHFASWIASLAYTSVASSLFLVTLHPVLVGLVSQRLWGEGPGAWGYAGMVVALAGGLVITTGDATTGSDPLLGDALALLGAVSFAAYFLAGRSQRRRLGLLAYVTPVYAASTLTLGLMLLALPPPWGGRVVISDPQAHGLFLALAFLPMIAGHTVLNWALRYVPAPVISTSILGEPLGGTLLAYLVLHELPPANALGGGLLVLAGIAMVVLSSGSPKRPGSAPR